VKKLVEAFVRAAAPIPDHPATASIRERPPGGREHDSCFPAAIAPADGCYPRAETASDRCFPVPATAPARLQGSR
jgi:hypothetical protein